MPYIEDREDRKILSIIINEYLHLFQRKGRLNFFLFKLAKETCKSYEDYEKLIGQLEMAKHEILRRQSDPYEDKAIEKNGDVK